MLVLLLAACTASVAPPAFRGDTGVDVRELPFDEQVLLVAHNAFNSTAMGFPIANQTLDYEAQLDLGVRGFMLE